MTIPLLELIGKRVLATTKHRGYGSGLTQVEELRLLEASPSGNYVLTMNIHGQKFWRPVIDVLLVEELKPIEPRPQTPTPITFEQERWRERYIELRNAVWPTTGTVGPEVVEKAKAHREFFEKQR